MQRTWQAVALWVLGSCGSTGDSDGGNDVEDGNGGDGALFEDVLDLHNQERALLGLTPLQWHAELAATAADWSSQCNFSHDMNRDFAGEIFGENLAWGSSGLGQLALSQLWMDEKHQFNCQTNQCSGVCGHFTQVIWETTTQLGCGTFNCGDSLFLTCRYLPAGNVVGQRPVDASACP